MKTFDAERDAERELLEHLVLDFRQMTQFAAQPWVFERGEGVRLQDDTGKWYLDGLSGVFVTSLGYGNERVLGAAIEQLRKLHFAPPLHGTTRPALELAARLRRLAPEGMRDGPRPGSGAAGRNGTGAAPAPAAPAAGASSGGVAVKLLSGGSEATEAAMKLARQYWKQAGHPRKYKIVGRYGGYHGATMGALSATGSWERKSVFEPLVAGFLHHHPPHVLRDLLRQLGSCPSDAEVGVASARLLERTIEAEDPETVAAVIVEPVSVSSAGFAVPHPEYYRVLRETCDRLGVLLIFDEIITGFGRLGEWFGAQYAGVAPDLLCCGKGMGGGYAPLAAVLIAGSVWDAFLGLPEERLEFHHGHTFGGNPVAAAVGCAAVDEIEARDLIGNARRVGSHLRSRLEALAREFPDVIGDVRGAGLLQGFEFDAGRFPKSERPGKRFEALAREHGLLARCGDEFVAFAPPLVTERAELDEMLDVATDCLHELAD
ncbi:MAG TPA: aminotransferase class III-fold pyridoxal phosphate-dependent enzyme [Chloroflexota bacterium]|nr:aminotransferase class III-fold pyridoxal phosphate-dependent enzyme [Chloroflexota bacterium]